MPDFLAAAVELATEGWAVFPCEPRGKRPITRHGLKDATHDQQQITRWWTNTPDANIGVACGAPSGIYVIDLDGPTGINSWMALCVTHGAPPDTLISVTGSGGMHLIYAATGLPNTASKLGAKIDTRGDGGYIVAPPSIHPNGTTYRWERWTPFPGTPLADLPQWVRDRVTTQPRDDAPEPVYTDEDTPYGKAAAERAAADIRGAGQGTRNDTLNACAYSIGRVVSAGHLTRRTAWDTLLAAAIDNGLTKHEAENTLRSGLSAGDKNPATIAPRDATSRIRYGFRPRLAGGAR